MQQYPFLYSIRHTLTSFFFTHHLKSFFASIINFIINCKIICILKLELGYLLRVFHLLILSYNHKFKYY